MTGTTHGMSREGHYYWKDSSCCNPPLPVGRVPGKPSSILYSVIYIIICTYHIAERDESVCLTAEKVVNQHVLPGTITVDKLQYYNIMMC